MEVSSQTTSPPTFSSQPPKRAGIPRASSAAPAQEEDKKAQQEQQRENQRVLQQLRSRDREVRAHEAAHVAAAGQYVASGPSYTFQRGPDGNSYAIGGEVRLDTSQEADADKQLDKSETIRRAALAPAQPSSQDFSVAANATRSAAQARLDIAVERRNEAEAQRQELETATDESGESREREATEIEQSPESSETEQPNRTATQNTSKAAANNLTSLYSQQSRPVGGDFNQFV